MAEGITTSQALNVEYRRVSAEKTMRLAEQLIQRGFAQAMIYVRRSTIGVKDRGGR